MPAGRTVHDLVESHKGEYMIDLLDATEVEIQVDSFGKTHINIDGVCVARVGKTLYVRIIDTHETLHEVSTRTLR